MANILGISQKARIGQEIEQTYEQLVRLFAELQVHLQRLQDIQTKMQSDPATFTPEDLEVVNALLWAINQFVDTAKTPANDINQVIQAYKTATTSSAGGTTGGTGGV